MKRREFITLLSDRLRRIGVTGEKNRNSRRWRESAAED